MFFFYFMEYYMNLILLLLLSVVLFTLSGCREAVSGVPEAPPRPAAVTDRTSQEKRNYELPVARTVQIKRHEAESTTRLSVMLTFRIGHLTLEQEFTLADREKFEYPVLLGRNVISGLAAVDPSRHNTL